MDRPVLTSLKESFNVSKNKNELLKFIYSENATNFCEISTVDLSYVVTVKSSVKILENFVAFSEDMNFKDQFGSLDSHL